MMAFLLLVTWLGYVQPPSHYQVEFSSNEACEAARLQLIKDAERIRQSMIERATEQGRTTSKPTCLRRRLQHTQ
jgi:hypothetical protein